MNHLLITHPHSEGLIKKAKTYFNRVPKLEKTKNATLAFFEDKNALQAILKNKEKAKKQGEKSKKKTTNNITNIYISGLALNPEEIPTLCKNQTFEDIDALAILAYKKEENIMIITDFFGHQPLYVYKHKNTTITSTSLDFLALNVPKKTIDWEAWSDIFSFGFCMENKTQFKEIKRAPRGTVITLGSNITKKRYKDFMTIKEQKLPLKEQVERFDKALQNTYKKILNITKNPILPLSGGTDSRLFTATLAKYQKPVCISTTKDLGKLSGQEEIVYARKVAKATGATLTEHQLPKEYFLRAFEEVLVKVNFQSRIHTWYSFLRDLIPKKHDLIIEGNGGAIFKSDYITTHQIKLAKKKKWKKLYQFLENTYKVALVDNHANDEELLYFDNNVQREIQKRKKTAFRQQLEKFPKNDNLPFNVHMHLRLRRLIAPSVYQLLAEKHNMCSPYLAKEVGECLFSIPTEQRADLKFSNAYFQRKLPKVANLPSTTLNKGIKRKLESAFFDFAGHAPKLAKWIIQKNKPKLMKGSSQYEEKIVAWLIEVIEKAIKKAGSKENSRQSEEKTKRMQRVLNAIKGKSVTYKIDVLATLAMFVLWEKRYFK